MCADASADDRVAKVREEAAHVFGSLAAADDWLSRPVIGLDRQRPIDLVATPEGRGRVLTYLGQIEFGVYV